MYATQSTNNFIGSSAAEGVFLNASESSFDASESSRIYTTGFQKLSRATTGSLENLESGGTYAALTASSVSRNVSTHLPPSA